MSGPTLSVNGLAKRYGENTVFAGVSLDTDGIFSDGYSLQLARTTGNATDGYTMTLNVPV